MIYLADPLYNPEFSSSITSSTKLGPGVTLAKFLGSKGGRVQLEQLTVDKKQLARNLYLHAEVIKRSGESSLLETCRLIVSEGVYKPFQGEMVTPESYNDTRQTGRTIIYQVINRKGETDISKSFELAEYWKDYLQYDLLALDYDTYDPSGSLTTSIILTMPEVPSSFDIKFQRGVLTSYNGQLLSLNELVEVEV